MSLSDLYFLLPSRIQSFLISLYGMKLYRKRYSGSFSECLEEIEKSEQVTSDQILSLQKELLRKIVGHAYRNVPYYKRAFSQHGLDEGSIDQLKNINQLPVLEKEAFRFSASDFRSSSENDRTYFIQNTSGSSGKPLRIEVNEKAYKMAMASLVHHEQLNGVRLGEPRATFAGRMIKKIEDNQAPFCRFNKAENQMLFSAYHISAENIQYYVKELNSFAPAEIIGYPSAIYSLAYELDSSCQRLSFTPKLIVTNSETLFSWQKELIEKVFNCPVRDYYGTAEYVVFGRQCSEMNYHINVTMGLVEVVNEFDTPVYDKEGELVCTTLINNTMPLIRYKIGDRAVMGSGQCACGSQLPYLSKIVGRVDDYVSTVDGRKIGRLDHIYKGLDGIKEGQIIQEKAGQCIVKIVKGNSSAMFDERKLLSNFKDRVGEDMDIKVEYVDEIPKGKNGKFKAVINRTA